MVKLLLLRPTFQLSNYCLGNQKTIISNAQNVDYCFKTNSYENHDLLCTSQLNSVLTVFTDKNFLNVNQFSHFLGIKLEFLIHHFSMLPKFFGKYLITVTSFYFFLIFNFNTLVNTCPQSWLGQFGWGWLSWRSVMHTRQTLVSLHGYNICFSFA